jgi:hypothetical protein
MNVKDIYGKYMTRDYIQAALRDGNAWVDYYWYKPGHNTAALKHTYVKKVNFGNEIYIIGAGFYPDQDVAPRRE